MNNRKNTILALLLVLVLVSIAYLFLSSATQEGKPAEIPDTFCTADALQCPDGSWVGRSGPECQSVCPVATSTEPTVKEVSLTATIGQRASGLGVQIVPTEIVEDSRCPLDVQCIQAGTVRIRATILSGLGTSLSILELNKPITTEAETVTLVSVSPIPESTKTITLKDYRFTFKVTKR